MTIPIPRLPFVAIAVLALIISAILKVAKRDDPANYLLTFSGVCALIALSGG